jgi:tRNA splicing endonuclease
MLGVRVLMRLALDFEHHMDRVGQPDDEVRFIDLRVAVKLVGNVELQSVIARVAENDPSFASFSSWKVAACSHELVSQATKFRWLAP